MTVLLVEPGKYPQPVEIGTDLEDLQKAVGGYIEVTYPFDEQVGIVMNEEGKINGMDLNRALRDVTAGLRCGRRADAWSSALPMRALDRSL